MLHNFEMHWSRWEVLHLGGNKDCQILGHVEERNCKGRFQMSSLADDLYFLIVWEFLYQRERTSHIFDCNCKKSTNYWELWAVPHSNDLVRWLLWQYLVSCRRNWLSWDPLWGLNPNQIAHQGELLQQLREEKTSSLATVAFMTTIQEFSSNYTNNDIVVFNEIIQDTAGNLRSFHR